MKSWANEIRSFIQVENIDIFLQITAILTNLFIVSYIQYFGNYDETTVVYRGFPPGF